MTPDEIMLKLFMLRKEGISISSIARNLKPPCSRQAVSGVINRKIKSRRIAVAVANALQRDVREVFPEYKFPDSTRQ